MNLAPRWRQSVLGITLVGLWTMALSARILHGQPTAPDDRITAIQAVLDRQQADWNRGDLEAFLNGYWKSPRVVFQSGGDRHDGWEAMAQRYRKRYKTEGKAMGSLSFSRLEVELLGTDAAFVRGGWRLIMPDGSKPGGLFTLIFRRFSEGWKIVHDHTSAEEPSKPESSRASSDPKGH
jgi:beta-aspartyl-peptidase (threonine type)